MSYYINLSIEKQLCVNQLVLPVELLDIIKKYAFTDIITYMAKIRKNTIHTLIQCTRWSYRNKKYDRYMFWIEEDIKCRQYQMTFCETCGNYTTNNSYDVCEKIICTC
jgi:hypothetical protein